MKLTRLALALLLAAAPPLALQGQAVRGPGAPPPGQLSRAFRDQIGGGSGAPSLVGEKNSVVHNDSDADGSPDYALYYDASGALVREELDFNLDGKMDDIRHYRGGVPVREEIDSDFDGRVDIWVHIIEGSFIERYERDTDGDGQPDLERSWGR
jgi:hypothetical protein